MRDVVAIFLMVAGLAMTLGFLLVGIIGMVRGGDFNRKWGNRLMRMRVISQMLALLMFALGLYILNHS